MSKKVFKQIQNLTTEQRNPRTYKIDSLSTLEILSLINSEDQKVALAVKKELPEIARAVDLIVSSFKQGGRLFYVGAGTSGRLGVLDAAECPPTFGTNPRMVQGLIAGGFKTLIRSQEGVEDDYRAGKKIIQNRKINSKDVVVGIAASKRTPFVLAALAQARKQKAKTVFLYCSPEARVKIKVDVKISPVVGPEVIMGSTRMKAGTAQKMALNMLTTASMIKLGKVYENMMVDLRTLSEKLQERANRILMLATGVDYQKAKKYLKNAQGNVKTAILMIKTGCSYQVAIQKLKKSAGFVSRALNL